MTVFEVVADSAWNDWASRSNPTRIGLFTSRDKAEAKIKEMKRDKEWKMSWSGIGINEVEVE
jgi:hypothetical protein